MTDSTFPTVEFRMLLTVTGPRKSKLLELYRRKFGALMKAMYGVHKNSLDYDDLPALRATLANRREFKDVEDVVFKQVKPPLLQLLLDAAPMYSVCPTPMQAYILLSAGVRSTHFEDPQP